MARHTRAVAGGDDRQVPAVTSDGELRYLAVRRRLTDARGAGGTGAVPGQAELARLVSDPIYGRARVGTLAELVRPGLWEEERR